MTASNGRELAIDTRARHDLTVGLMGHSLDSDNLGIGALTISHISMLEGVCERLGITATFRVLGSQDSPRTYIRAKNLIPVPIRTRSYVSPINGLYKAVRQCDVILDITGGDSFADIYRGERFLRVAIAKMVALMARRPFILSPQTIGPFQRRWTKRIAVELMRRTHLIVSRDNLSSKFVSDVGLGSKLLDSTDVAFRLPYAPPEPARSGKTRVGLNISGLLFNGGYTRDNMFRLRADYADLSRVLVRYFSEQDDCELHLIGHVNSLHMEVEDDYRVAQRLRDEFPGAVVAPRFSTPSEAKSYIASMDFFAGSRMHACIAALSSGVPVLPIAYSRKFAGVFGGLGYSLVADCQTESVDSVLRKAVDAFERRNELRAHVEAACANANKKLAAYEAVLAECFLEAAGKRA